MEQKERWKLAGDGLNTIYWANIAALVAIVVMTPATVLMLLGIHLKGVESVLAVFGLMLGLGGGVISLLAYLSIRRAHTLYEWTWRLFLISLGLIVLQIVILLAARKDLTPVQKPIEGALAIARLFLTIRGTNLLLEEAQRLDPALLRLSKWTLYLMVAYEILLLLPKGLFGPYQMYWNIGADMFGVVSTVIELIYLRDAGRRLLRAAGA